MAACRDNHILAIHAKAYLHELNHSTEKKGSSLSLFAWRLLFTLRDLEICAQPSSLQRVIRFLTSHRPRAASGRFDICLPGRKRGIIEVVSLARLQQMDAALAARETLPA